MPIIWGRWINAYLYSGINKYHETYEEDSVYYRVIKVEVL
jgi:hypothetical protein